MPWNEVSLGAVLKTCDPQEQAFIQAIVADAAAAIGVTPAALMLCQVRPSEHQARLERIAAFDEMTANGWRYDLLREVFVWPESRQASS